MLFFLLATQLPTLILADKSTCKIGHTRDIDVNMADIVGDIYWMYHEENELEQNILCARDTLSEVVNNESKMTTLVYSERDGKKGFSEQEGVVKNWTGSSFNSEYYDGSIWESYFYFIDFVKGKYVAIKACLMNNTTPYTWIGFPTNRPDKADIDAAKARVQEVDGNSKDMVLLPDCDKMPPSGQKPKESEYLD